MTNPEIPFSPIGPEIAVIGMTNKFTGINYPHNLQGLRDATVALRLQHEKILPPIPATTTIERVVAEKNPAIQLAEQMVKLALEDEDYELAMTAANHLFIYGETDSKDSLAGEAFDFSLGVHREFTERIRDRFSTSDPFLRMAWPRILPEILKSRQQGNFHRELELLRALIHTVALNGTLGENAKQQFDPFAIVQIR